MCRSIFSNMSAILIRKNIFQTASSRPTNLGGRNLQVHKDRVEGGLEQLGGVVDGVAVEHDQLEGLGQLEDPLDLVLHLDKVGAPEISCSAIIVVINLIF